LYFESVEVTLVLVEVGSATVVFSDGASVVLVSVLTALVLVFPVAAALIPHQLLFSTPHF